MFLSNKTFLMSSASVHGRAAAMATLHYLIKNEGEDDKPHRDGPDDLPLTWLKDAATAIIDALTTDGPIALEAVRAQP